MYLFEYMVSPQCMKVARNTRASSLRKEKVSIGKKGEGPSVSSYPCSVAVRLSVVSLEQVEHKCPNCGNDEMTYTTQQTRSADEGQTVFYTCPKCK